MEMETNIIYNEDCLTRLKQIPDNSIDLICTDPPYMISFMNKKWDSTKNMYEFFLPIWKEALRVLKSGAFAFVMCSPRQDVLSQQIRSLTDAGFNMDFSSIYWTYSSGFPKAHNVGKKEVTLKGAYGGFQPKPAVEIIIVAMKPMTENTFTAQALNNGKGVTWLDDCRIPYANESDKKQHQNRWNINQVSQSEGWGMKQIDLSPYKPETGRFPANLLVSDDVLNNKSIKSDKPSAGKRTATFGNQNTISGGEKDENWVASDKGRFPANLLVSDDILNDGIITGTGKGPTLGTNTKFNYQKHGNPYIGNEVQGIWVNDKGSYSRYFDLDAWAEVNGIQQDNNTFPFLITPKASKKEKNAGCEHLTEEVYNDETRLDKDAIGCNNPCNRSGTPKAKNNHPCVKPLKLMSYLITLGSREGDIILEPFAGSFTTCVAAQQLNRKWIGIEMSEEYCEIGRARISASLQTKQ